MLRISLQAQLAIARKEWPTHAALDQGDTPQCVAFSAEQWLLAGPVRNKLYATPADLYALCQAADGMALPHDGSTGNAAFKVLQQLGYAPVYRWAQGIGDVTGHLLQHGPVVFYTDWLNGMFDPDAAGFVHAEGPIAGGHAYLIKGCDLHRPCPDGGKGALKILNSWSPSWGGKGGAGKGAAWLSLGDAAKLLAANGEAAEATEVKLAQG